MFGFGRKKRTIEAEITADNSKLKKGLKQSQKELGSFQRNVKNIGTSIVAYFAFDQIVSGFKSIINSASDAQETLSKFETVFKHINNAANDSAEELSNSYGLSDKAAQELLGNTGDLLTGFGFSQKAALDLSTSVNKLAVDLASFTNYSGGATGASQALTKALLGERESVKSLGISILEEDVKKQVAINTAKGLIFETERQAKAYATLDLAIKQSQNAVGDYGRTSESFANQQRELGASIEDISVTIGSIFVPALSKGAGELSEYIDNTNEFLQDVLTEGNMSKIEKWARILGGGLVGTFTGGRFGAGITGAISQDAFDTTAPQRWAEEFIAGIDAITDKEERRKQIINEIIGLQNKSRELYKSESEEHQRIGALMAKQATIMQSNFETYVNLKDEQVAADKAAAEAAIEEQKKVAAAEAKAEAERREALGIEGRLMEDIKLADAEAIAANSIAEKKRWTERKLQLEQELKLLRERISLEMGGAEADQRGLTGITPMPSLGAPAISPQGVPELVTGLEQVQTQAESTTESFINMQQAGVNAAYAIGSALGEMVGESDRTTREILSNLLKQITAMLMQSMMASLPFPANIAAAAGAGLISQGLFSQIPGYADGTNYHTGGLAIVGERGPELVNLPRGSSVYTNQESMGMMGGKVEFEIRGDRLFGVLRNYGNRINNNT